MTRWSEATGGQGGRDYAARFDALAARGADVHGEAGLCAEVALPGSRVLDAGCGTGRVAIRLAELGYAVTGTDVDPSMLEVARDRAPDIAWVQADLANLDLLTDDTPAYDLVVVAGNVVPLVAPGTEAAAVSRAAAHVAPGGLLVSGFGLDRAHLPAAAALVDLADYDSWCRAAGLTAVRRLATWGGDPYESGGGYAVSIHARPLAGRRLTLETLSVDHAAAMASLMDDDSLHSFTGGAPLRLEETRARFARQVVGRSVDGYERWFNWVARDQETAVGTVQATVTDTTRGPAAELAWVVGKAYQSRGFAQEAAQIMSRWLRAHGIVELVAHIHPDHVASKRVAQSLGMTPSDVIVDGEVRWQA